MSEEKIGQVPEPAPEQAEAKEPAPQTEPPAESGKEEE